MLSKRLGLSAFTITSSSTDAACAMVEVGGSPGGDVSMNMSTTTDATFEYGIFLWRAVFSCGAV